MDGTMILLIIFWIANNALMYRLGYKRALDDALKLAEEMAAPDHAHDGAYWKIKYEELAEEWDELMRSSRIPLREEDFERGEAAE